MTTCNCTKPPGGGGRCSSSQIAICRTDGINCFVSCIDISAGLLRQLKLGRARASEVYDFVLSNVGDDYEPVKTQKSKNVMSGTLVNKNNLDVINFKLPTTKTKQEAMKAKA